MSARIPPGFFETRLHFVVPGQDGDVMTSFGWAGTPPTTPELRLDVVGCISEIMGNLSEEITLNSIDFVLGQDGPDDVVVSETVDFPGLAGGSPLPPNSAYLVQKRTATPGRRGRGRNYLPGVVRTVVDDGGVVDPLVVAGINTNLSDMVDCMDGHGYTPELFHQTAPFTPSLVTSFIAQPKIATQRGRLRG